MGIFQKEVLTRPAQRAHQVQDIQEVFIWFFGVMTALSIEIEGAFFVGKNQAVSDLYPPPAKTEKV